MNHYTFNWDPNKEAINRRKHGISFFEAISAFSDELGRLIADPEHSDLEDRFVLLGISSRGRLLVVIHCVSKDDSIRVISARRANKQERKAYEGYKHA